MNAGDAPSLRRTRVDDAIADLSRLTNSDPAARGAMHAITLTRYTLEFFWAPALSERVALAEPDGRCDAVS